VFRPIPNTLNKYPLFGKLGSPKQNGANGKRLIYVTHGVDINFDSTDAGVRAFLGTISELEKIGFTEKEKIVDESNGKHWVYTATANGYEIELHTGLYKSKVWQDNQWKDNKDFYDYVRLGLTNADIFVYNGHSGLGGTLPPSKFPQLKLPAKYQVFFFNGCSTFSYYNDNYFDKKKETTGRPGSESMEIVTSGLETFFGLQKFMTSSLINDLAITPNYPKWENIITNLYNQTSKSKYGDQNQWQMDPKIYSGQYQVNGDEDNPSDLAEALK
jgi:hypothetical protein